MVDRYHDNNLLDCKTEHFVLFYIGNKKKLEQIEGRHYYDLNSNNEKDLRIKNN